MSFPIGNVKYQSKFLYLSYRFDSTKSRLNLIKAFPNSFLPHPSFPIPQNASSFESCNMSLNYCFSRHHSWVLTSSNSAWSVSRRASLRSLCCSNFSRKACSICMTVISKTYIFKKRKQGRTLRIFTSFQSFLTSGWNRRASEKAFFGLSDTVLICSASNGRWSMNYDLSTWE